MSCMRICSYYYCYMIVFTLGFRKVTFLCHLKDQVINLSIEKLIDKLFNIEELLVAVELP